MTSMMSARLNNGLEARLCLAQVWRCPLAEAMQQRRGDVFSADGRRPLSLQIVRQPLMRVAIDPHQTHSSWRAPCHHCACDACNLNINRPTSAPALHYLTHPANAPSHGAHDIESEIGHEPKLSLIDDRHNELQFAKPQLRR